MNTTSFRSARRSRFQPGTGVFKCEVCGRGTRNTGVQSLDNRLCPQCYELAGHDNLVNDTGGREGMDEASLRWAAEKRAEMAKFQGKSL